MQHYKLKKGESGAICDTLYPTQNLLIDFANVLTLFSFLSVFLSFLPGFAVFSSGVRIATRSLLLGLVSDPELSLVELPESTLLLPAFPPAGAGRRGADS